MDVLIGPCFLTRVVVKKTKYFALEEAGWLFGKILILWELGTSSNIFFLREGR